MKKLLFSIVSILGFCLLFPSCEKDVESITSLDGDYVLQKAEVVVFDEMDGEDKITSLMFSMMGEGAKERYIEFCKNGMTLEFNYENESSPRILINGLTYAEFIMWIRYGTHNSDELPDAPVTGPDEHEFKLSEEMYMLHDYEYIFERNGSLSAKPDYDDKKFETGRYKVDNGMLYFSQYGFEIPAFNILSNKGGTLELELNPVLLGLLTLGRLYEGSVPYEITRSVGYYKKK